MFTNVTAGSKSIAIATNNLPPVTRNTLPRVTIKDNPICPEDSNHYRPLLLPGQSSSGINNHHHQSSNQSLIDYDSNLNNNHSSSANIAFNSNSHQRSHQQYLSSSNLTAPYTNQWKRLTVYIVLTVILLLVILNGATTIWIMAQTSFSTNGMGSLSIDSQGIKLNGQAYFLQDVFAPKISSPQDKRIRINSKVRTELGLKNDQENIVNKLQLTRSTVVAVSDQLTIKNHLGKTLLALDDSGLKLSPTKLKITGSNLVELQGSIQTASVKCTSSSSSSSSSSPSSSVITLPDLSISSLTRGILIRGISQVNMDANNGLISIESLKDLNLISTNRKINLNATWIVLNNLKTVIASRSGRSYPNVLTLCACPNGNLFVSSSDNQCNAHENTVCGNHYSTLNDQQHINNINNLDLKPKQQS